MSRFYLVCFDVTDQRRLRAIAKTLEDFGQRVQRSIFECYLDEQQRKTLQQKIIKLIDSETDHVRYYQLCQKDLKSILIDGCGRISKNDDFHLF